MDSFWERAAAESQARCDNIQAEFRAEQQAHPSIRRDSGQRPSIRRDAPPLPKALVPTDNVLKLRLAEELEYARRMIEIMGDTLSADPSVVTRHMVPLQSIDIAGQLLGSIANIIRSSDPDSAVDLIENSELKGRLKRAGGI
jgi:hypothetical protein